MVIPRQRSPCNSFKPTNTKANPNSLGLPPQSCKGSRPLPPITVVFVLGENAPEPIYKAAQQPETRETIRGKQTL